MHGGGQESVVLVSYLVCKYRPVVSFSLCMAEERLYVWRLGETTSGFRMTVVSADMITRLIYVRLLHPCLS